MTTRAGAAAYSRQVNQRLVRLLFDHEYAVKGREHHRQLLDFASYTYSDLRKAYLDRIQTTHPDKLQGHGILNLTLKRDITTYFIELQDAWEAYEKCYKHMRPGTDEKDEGSFTMFGVGCSFSDNPTERELRNQIMDQACKGWFSAGALNNTANHEIDISNTTTSVLERSTHLSDDNLFVNGRAEHESPVLPKRSLVDHVRFSRK